MALLVQYFLLCAPLFGTVLAGYVLAKLPFWQSRFTQLASKVVFAVLLPALLFHKLSDVASLPPVDTRLLLAFFGGCFIVFAIGRFVAFTSNASNLVPGDTNRIVDVFVHDRKTGSTTRVNEWGPLSKSRLSNCLIRSAVAHSCAVLLISSRAMAVGG